MKNFSYFNNDYHLSKLYFYRESNKYGIMEILIAEDDISIANSLKKNFLEDGHHAVVVGNGADAITMLEKIEFDAILLDWRMPKKNGLETCREIRKSGNKIPIILLTALSEVSNKIEALNIGADDYITKPFSFEEVLARIKAVTRRFQNSNNTLEFENLSLNLITRELETPKGFVKLPDKEFELLKYFIQNKGSIISKETLCEDVWKLTFDPGTNIVEATVKNLRKKLEENTSQKFIRTIYGEGYLFIAD